MGGEVRVSIRKILDVDLHNALSHSREKYAIWQLLTNILLAYCGGESRIFAVDNEDNKKNYIITGGAIKLTKTMQEREHTLRELYRQEQVRNFLLSHDIIDTDSFIDYLTEIK